MGRRGIEPQAPMKFVIAIGLLAMAFLVLSFGIATTPQGQLVALSWFILNYLLLVLGELCLAPVSSGAPSRAESSSS